MRSDTDTENSPIAGVDRRSFLGLGALAAAGALAGCGNSSEAPAAAATDSTAASSGPAPYIDGETVETTLGRIKGSRRGAVHAFRGVPYGAPTGAASRFLPARAAAAWSDVR